MPAAESLPRWAAPLFILLLAVAGGLAGVLAGRAWIAPAPPARGDGILVEGSLAPDLQLRDLDGELRRLADYRGRPVLINFWATWCPPCVRELPLLQDLHQRRDHDGVTVLSIAQEDDAEAVRRFLADLEVDLPAWIDPPSRGDASRQFGNLRNVLPFSVLIGADGRVLQRKAGQFSEAELQRWARLARDPVAAADTD